LKWQPNINRVPVKIKSKIEIKMKKYFNFPDKYLKILQIFEILPSHQDFGDDVHCSVAFESKRNVPKNEQRK
tara:strand:+ start:654 stop:869 length:216 start_codon:yes stop_codon:yes gene_type:complete